MKSRFLEKNYPRRVINDAIERTMSLSQDECLRLSIKQTNKIEKTNYIPTNNQSSGEIKKIINKHWSVFLNDPFLRRSLPIKPQFTFRRARTLKNVLAHSRLRQVHLPDNPSTSVAVELKPLGSYRCGVKIVLISNPKRIRLLVLILGNHFPYNLI